MAVRQVTIISGKGGTGKTSLTASFAALARRKVLADCDVDAADLHLILQPKIKQRNDFYSGKVARIDPELCTECGICEAVCRFDAIHNFVVDDVACEGCSFCAHMCPEDAIEMVTRRSGEWFISETRYGPMVHARLGIAEENSGKLVTLVRNQAKMLAEKEKLDYVLVDGPPGVGCPVISSITGVDLVVAVTEPTLSGIHDLQRVLQVAGQFRVPALVVINKYDLNREMSDRIAQFCDENGIPLVGKIPFDTVMVDALMHRLPVVEYSRNGTSQVIREIWARVERHLQELPEAASPAGNHA